jgi:hypothetical protein
VLAPDAVTDLCGSVRISFKSALMRLDSVGNQYPAGPSVGVAYSLDALI